MTPEELDDFWANWHIAWAKKPHPPVRDDDDDPREPYTPEPLSPAEEARLDNAWEQQMDGAW